jgi:hypothetical protein
MLLFALKSEVNHPAAERVNASFALYLQRENLARLAFSDHLERATADLTISGEALGRHGCVEHQRRRLAAVRTDHLPFVFHEG